MKLNIANDNALKLPLDFVTERIAFIARTGAGKSGGMRVLAEQMLEANQFIIFLDPKGDAWGIRSEYPVLIMGGEHGDVPLEATAGKFVADFLVKDRVSTVLDVSEFSEADMVRFVGDFADRFYRLNREAVHWFIDEADEFAPQSGYNQAALKCLGAIQRIQRRGRGRGIGVTLATQRSAVINKSVLTQAGTLIAMQTTAPHDLKAVDAWLEYAATKEARNQIMGALPTLKPREAFVYSPQFLGTTPHRITFRTFKSFDSMRTPKHGEATRKPPKLADLDLAAITKEMASTIEELKQNDPVELRKQIAELKRKSPMPDERALERAIQERDRHWQIELGKLQKAHQSVVNRIEKIAALATLNGDASVNIETPKVVKSTISQAFKISDLKAQPPLSKAEAAILRAFYWTRGETITPSKIGFYAGYSASSGGFNNALGKLRSSNFLFGWNLTTEGEKLAATYARAKPSGKELREWLRPKLQRAENSILDVLLDVRGERLPSEKLAELSGYSANSGGFNNALGRLRTLEAVEGYERDGGAKAADVFFE